MDEIKSPMYATAVGLVIRGLQEAEKERRNKKKHPHIIQPGKTKGKWFDLIFKKGIFGDEGDDKEL